MNILYDGQVFTQNHGGISRYFCELFAHFKSSDEITCDLPVVFSNNHYLNSMNIIPDLKPLNDPSEVGANVNLAVQHLTGGQFDIFHPTYYDPYFLKYLGNKPFVLTIFDMTHEIFAEYFGRDDLTRRNKEILARKASKIIAISHSTKKDIVDLLAIDEKLIEVIHLASPFHKLTSATTPRIENGPEYYLLLCRRTMGV